jgi:CRISPR-associated protein Csy2
MKSLLILRRIYVENANAIAGLTYGFPAITHFLGFTHALSRLLQKEFSEITLDRCGVIVHRHQVKTQQPKGWGDSVFCLTRNPLTKEGNTAPFNEEGKMHMEVSLLIEANGYMAPDTREEIEFLLDEKLPTLRLAGGNITHCQPARLVNIPDDEKSVRRLMFSLLPGFVLIDRSTLLQAHCEQLKAENPKADILDAWLDFSALKYRAVPEVKEGELPTEDTKAIWEHVPKPSPGYLVPIMTGYKGISPLYPAGEVANARDSVTPFRFVEAAYGIGEWVSPHKFTTLESVFWQYQSYDDWYLCKQA